MIVIALDLSLTCTGMAVYNSGNRDWTSIKTSPKMLRHERYQQIAVTVVNAASKGSLAFLEDYAYGVGPAASQLSTLSELGGVVKYRLWQATGIYPIAIAPATIKKFVTGKGNSKKEQMLLHVYKKYGLEFATNDECDAYCLLDLALTALGHSHRDLNQKEQEAVSVVQQLLRAQKILNLVANLPSHK
ncbi:MAG: hypothetical protein HY913_04245 [Desulfomonile tiedjei]|nr:hypothetical protein [Desulfomonile tiedjei]